MRQTKRRLIDEDYVLAVFVTVVANNSILETKHAVTATTESTPAESLLSVHRLILIAVVTTLAVIATQRYIRKYFL